MNQIDVETVKPGAFPQIVRTRKHTFLADVGTETGGEDSAPGPHDFFDSALATCKALTSIYYARKNNIPLDRVEAHVERDATREKEGVYILRVKLAFHGPLSEDQRAALYQAAGKCPIHKLMTTADVQVETAP